MKLKIKKSGKLILALALSLFFIFSINALDSFSSSSTSVVQTQYFSPAISNQFGGAYSSYLASNLQTGEDNGLFDLEVMIPPLGCQPYVVRSDLLEEQNVPVFCQLVPIKVNPGIDITRIESIDIKQKEQNQYISGVGFHPAQAAILSRSSLTSAPTSSNLGYVVVVLKKQEIEKNMPDSVNVTLSATLRYGANYAYGIGPNEFYLPLLSDSDFENNYLNYGFFNGVGYLRVENLDDNSATISIYKSQARSNSDLTRFFNQKIDLGKTSNDYHLTTWTGGQGLRVTLKDITLPETYARIKVNGQLFEVYKGGSFFNGKCSLRDLQAQGGGSGYARVYCSGKTFDLEKQFNLVDLIVNGNPRSLTIGQNLDDLSNLDDKNNFYLVYPGEILNATPREYYIFIANVTKTAYTNSEETVTKMKEVTKKLDALIKDKTKGITNSVAYKKALLEIESDSIKKQTFGSDVNLILISSGLSISNKINVKFSTLKNLDRPLSKYAQDYFVKSLDAYDFLKNSFSTETSFLNSKHSSGEDSLWAQYNLALILNQDEKANEILSRIENEYPDSRDSNGLTAKDYLLRNKMLSNKGSSAYYDKEDIFIELDSVNEPGFDQASVELSYYASDYSKDKNPRTLRKGESIFQDSSLNKSISLVDFDADKITVNYSCKNNAGDVKSGTLTGSRGKDISLAECSSRIAINKINYNKVAKVQIIPTVSGRSRENNFTFSIGIEKRADLFKLTPEEANKKIKEIDQQIAKWNNVTKKLGNFIEGEKAACLATSAYINIKNFFGDRNGEASARTEVMKRWNQLCASVEFQKNSNNAASAEECIANNYDTKIRPEIEATKNLMQSYNNFYDAKASQFGNNNTKIKEAIITNLSSGLTVNAQVNCRKVGNTTICDDLNAGNITAILNGKTVNQVTSSELTELYFALQMSQNNQLSEDSRKQYQELAYSKLSQLKERTVSTLQVSTLSQDFGGTPVLALGGEKTQEITTNLDTWGNVKKHIVDISSVSGVSDSDKVAIYYYAGYGNYLAILTPISGRVYGVDNNKLYSLTKAEVYYSISSAANAPSEVKNFRFVEGDVQSYKNTCKNCNEMKVFVLEPYKGMPALLPFDAEEGWYVQVKQTMPGLGTGNIKSYQDSGRVNTFWLCNVGKNGLVDQIGIADDICRRFDMYTGDSLDSFPGLTTSQVKSKISYALKAIEQAQAEFARNPSATTITITSPRSLTLKVKTSEGDLGSKCTDFMSPDECQLIFNVCDPVVCPNSRCDLGGTYKVDNVIQSGLIGSTFLCLPNFIGFHPNTGVVIPVCLTGINAGLQTMTSMLQDYRNCVNESVTTGKTTGICDMIYSVYVCDFVWRQAGPFVESMVSNFFTKAVEGKGSKGGAEYAFTSDAWNNAQKSAQYLQTSYGSNSKLTFGVKDFAQAAVADVCKVSFSATYPDKFDAMLEPESPVQFSASFEEIPYSSATVPATSQYSVSYFIYAGQDQGHYYQVYLKSAPTTLGYVGKDSALVASGYIEKGGRASYKKDLLEVSGFKELCVKIDTQEKCGFKTVSTSFAVNYATDKTLKEQATSSVTSESECIAGGSSLGAFLTPNIQQGVEQSLNPELYNQGIIRVCSSDNPASSVDSSRWEKVGYCDDRSIGCWIDTYSVKRAIRGIGIENQTLTEIDNMNKQALIAQGGYFDDNTAEAMIGVLQNVYRTIADSITISNVDGSSYNGLEKDFLNSSYSGRTIKNFEEDTRKLYAKLVYSKNKAHLLLVKAQIYNRIAENLGKEVASSAVIVPQTPGSNVITTTSADYTTNDVKKYIKSKQPADLLVNAMAIAQVESTLGSNTQTWNKSRFAIGIMQMSQIAAKDINVDYSTIDDKSKWKANIDAGIAYLNLLQTRVKSNSLIPHNERENAIVVSYNGGYSALAKVIDTLNKSNTPNPGSYASYSKMFYDINTQADRDYLSKYNTAKSSLSQGNAALIR